MSCSSGALAHLPSVRAAASLQPLELEPYAVTPEAKPAPNHKGREVWERSYCTGRADTVQTAPDTKPPDHTLWVSQDTGYLAAAPPHTWPGMTGAGQCHPTPRGGFASSNSAPVPLQTVTHSAKAVQVAMTAVTQQSL